MEIQHAIRLFKSIPWVFELRGTKRFEKEDPLIDFLACMRAGRRFPAKVWKAFTCTFALDNERQAQVDPWFMQDNFRKGYGMAMHWETLARWIPQRARRDARELGVPLVFLQAVDECNTIDREKAVRLLNVPNIHNTGHIHGVLPVHIGMEVRFTAKLNSKLGLVQEQRATVLSFLFQEDDQRRYQQCGPGMLFKPSYCPAGIWLEVHDFKDSPLWEDALAYVGHNEQRARSLLLYRPVQTEFVWRSSEPHTVRRTGFPLTHASFLTSTASQGQTLRKGIVIDCAMQENCGVHSSGDVEARWWLHLYVMFSRVTCMRNMLLLRPPPRELLEKGLPPSVREALWMFAEKITDSTRMAASWARECGMSVPEK